MEAELREQFVAYIDLLGFSASSVSADSQSTKSVLKLLQSLATLKKEFKVEIQKQPNGKTIDLVPAISTFSDHIVISYPLEETQAKINEKESISIIVILSNFHDLLVNIAAASLRSGFLTRGGATIGNLYHADGIVFGEGLIDAYRIESKISCYPRVVLSNTITQRREWMEWGYDIARGDDGLPYFNYYRNFALASLLRIKDFKDDVEEWFNKIVEIINKNIANLHSTDKQAELAKWVWFGKEFQKRTSLDMLEQFKLSFKDAVWPKYM